MDEEILKLKEEIKNLKEELKRLYGVERPFICGTAGNVGNDGLADVVLVCPMYGSDGFAIYKKYKDYSAPGY